MGGHNECRDFILENIKAQDSYQEFNEAYQSTCRVYSGAEILALELRTEACDTDNDQVKEVCDYILRR